MQDKQFAEVIKQITNDDPKFDAKAYSFVREGLDYTIKMSKRQSGRAVGSHVTGQELLEGLRRFTLKEYGPMSMMLLNEWGVESCEDFGRIVFSLVRHGVLGKSESDKLEDFTNAFTFEEAFVQPFLPAPSRSAKPARSSKPGRRRSPRRSDAPSNAAPEPTGSG
jgi:uncharacterized repeat protein (TIGR04138 family)